ncbi:MAG: 30S ribosomal protein S1 [Dysgonamonadaceae bacterium]|jgi:small subunit ribosomal protein S1|nr:30S ribosomal protein S1 [Dysgonamonadaceae bacterium]
MSEELIQKQPIEELAATQETVSPVEIPVVEEEAQPVEIPVAEEEVAQPVEIPAAEEEEAQSVEIPVAEEEAQSVEIPVAEEEAQPVEIPTAEEEAQPATPEEEAPVKEEIAEEKTKKPPVPKADFDWDAYEKGDNYSDVNKDELVKTYDQSLNKINDREVVIGKVTSMNKREVVINIGYKSDGVVSMTEFRYNTDLKVGDEVEVYIESQEDKKGQLILSHKKARATRSWDRVNQALESDEIVKGYVKCRTKGGMIVDVFGIEAFLPGSQIDVKPIRDYDVFVDKTMEFKVVKINQEFKNVVVSHKALIEAELEQQKKDIIAGLEKGQILEGVVKNITSYGVFIDLGGVDGLIHITDLSWGRVAHPEEIVQLDEKISVVILDFDNEKKRIALGLKQLTPHPWNALDENLKIGDVVKGRVVVMADYGAFIEIAPGVEGLIHVSEMSWTQHLRSAQDFMKVGDEVEAIILTLDREERKMSLGIKQLKPDPWEDVESKYAVGTKHTAKVRNFTNFGVFVEIEEGVEGLVHISDLSWTKKIKHPSEFTSIGAEIEVQVLEIDKENRRLSLGHKQLEENPWDVFETIFTVGSVHEGTIVELLDKGAVITLPYGVEGFATPKHLVKVDGSQAALDEKLEFKVIEFNKDSKRIILSHSRIFEDEQRAESKKEREAAAAPAEKKSRKSKKGKEKAEVLPLPTIERTTLGDISELAELKEKMTGNKE